MEKRPTTIDDLTQFRIPSDPQMSPDGTRIAFVLKTTDLAKNRYNTHIWLTSTGDGTSSPRQLTHSTGSEATPRWSPDGSGIAFTSGREEKVQQLYRLPMDGGEAEKITDLPAGGIGEYQWSPDGTRIAFTFRPQDEIWTEKASEERKKAKLSAPPREITRRHYREEGAGFVPATPFHIHILNLATRAVVVLTDGDRDASSLCWSPDGTQIAFVRNTAPDPDLMPGSRDIFCIPAEKPEQNFAEPKCIETPPGPKSELSWSPDGAHIAYMGHDHPEEVWGVSNQHPWVAAVDGSGARDLADGWDITCGSVAIGDVMGGGESGPFWSADSQTLRFLASDRGAVDIYRASLDGNAPPQRVTEGQHIVAGFSPDVSGEQLALLIATPTDTGDIYSMSLGKPFFKRLTRLNAEQLDTLHLSSPILFEAPTPDGHTVPCWALLPPDFADSPGPRPTLLYIHGGPHLMHAHTLFHEYQALAAAGYVVLYPNPRGSKGYGEAWTGAIRGNWGEPAHDDCLACVDYAVGQGWSDAERVGVAGGSYGGYLTGWMVGHTDRFKAALAERGVFNLVSMAGTCDFVWRDHDYFDSDTASDTRDYRQNSPLTYADAIQTPLLILHSEGDLRCPIEQSEQLFTALKMRGRDVVFLRYGPEGNHNLSRTGPPDLRLDRQRRIHAWFDKYLKSAPMPS